MPGGLLDLVAKGVADLYLVGNPQMTLFKNIYKRYVNFSIYDSVIKDRPYRDFGSSYDICIERNADLVGRMYLCVELPDIILKYVDATVKYVSDILATYGIKYVGNGYPNTILTLSSYNQIIDCTNNQLNQILNQQL